MRILIISTNAIGDTYMSLSALEPLKNHFGGDCNVDVITNQHCKILCQSVGVDNIYILKNKSLKSILTALHQCRQNYYSYVFSFFPGRINSSFLFLTATKYRIGFWNIRSNDKWWENTTESGFSNVNQKRIFYWNSSQSFYDRIKICLSFADIKNIQIQKPHFNFLSTNLQNKNKYILLHGQSSQQFRSFSPQTIDLLSDYFLKELNCEVRIIFWGDKKDLFGSVYDNLLKYTLLNNISLEEMVNQIINAKLFVAIESFPLHIADAYDSNFVGVYGPTNPNLSMHHPQKSIRLMTSNIYNFDSDEILNEIIKYCEEKEIV